MPTASNIAKFFLTLSEPDEGDVLTNLKLQKLCYYAQGFALAVLERPLFNEPILAWDHGPVVREVWDEYREFHALPLPVPKTFDAETLITKDERELLEEVWNVYGQFSAWKLRNMTHEESPWVDTERNAVISHDVLRDFFRTRLASGVHTS